MLIALIRSFIAFALSLVLTALTFGRVELNRTGGATVEDDSLGSSRPAASRQLDDGQTPDMAEGDSTTNDKPQPGGPVDRS